MVGENTKCTKASTKKTKWQKGQGNQKEWVH